MEETSQKMSQLSLPENDTCPTSSTDQVNPIVIDEPLTNYLFPVHKEYLKKLKPTAGDAFDANFQVAVKLKENLYPYIWGPDVFKASRPSLKRIYDEISGKLSVAPGQSDLEDMLQYHPVEVVSSKFIQVVVGMAMIEPGLVSDDFEYLEQVMKTERISMESSTMEAFEFLLSTLKHLFNVLTGNKVGNGNSQEPGLERDYNDLNRESKGIISGLSALYMKAFRVKPLERMERIKSAVANTPGNVEWIIYCAETYRLKRRETNAKFKRSTPQEMGLLEQALQMEPHNPFVRWNLIECVVDSLRESNGRFHCGDIIHLNDTDQAMRFLQDECKKLCQDFPKNVSFLSFVSDYFSRYVPYLYFDKELSSKLLLDAYQLNPKNPKTTHRLAIVYRMNMKNGTESLKWLEKTMELDPAHFNGNMDYYKTLIGKPETFKDVGKKMEDKLNSIEASYWRLNERTDFQFYVGLAYFAEGKTEDTLRHWTQVLQLCELHFPLSDVDSDCSIFCWNNKFISTDKIREWMQTELEQMKKLEASGDFDAKRKKNIAHIFHLMLGVNVPKRPDPMAGPYSDHFENKLV